MNTRTATQLLCAPPAHYVHAHTHTHTLTLTHTGILGYAAKHAHTMLQNPPISVKHGDCNQTNTAYRHARVRMVHQSTTRPPPPARETRNPATPNTAVAALSQPLQHQPAAANTTIAAAAAANTLPSKQCNDHSRCIQHSTSHGPQRNSNAGPLHSCKHDHSTEP
jgi:hypothetical protein